MDANNEPVRDLSVVGEQENLDDGVSVESLNKSVDEMFKEVDQLEQKVKEVEHFYSRSSTKQPSTPKSGLTVKEKDREKFLESYIKRQQVAARRAAAAAMRKRELMNEFGKILHHMIQQKWAAPFMQPVDVVGLGLHDYYDVIEKPMDFSTIKSKMEAKDGTGYKSIREICADVRLIFKNAMKYNDEKNDVHVMAKSLLDKFETRWLQLLPKVDEDEKLRKEEEAEMRQDMQLAQEVAHAKMARDLSRELSRIDMHLEDLKDLALEKCRKMTTEEKRRLGIALTRLSPENINKALEVIADNDPTFQATGDTVEVDIDAQTESTLWKLKFFVQDALQAQMKSSPRSGGEINQNQNGNNRRKREMCDAVVKNSQKKSKKAP